MDRVQNAMLVLMDRFSESIKIELDASYHSHSEILNFHQVIGVYLSCLMKMHYDYCPTVSEHREFIEFMQQIHFSSLKEKSSVI